MKKLIVLLSLSITFTISAQIKGVVKDSISGKPIPYVNIWVENENIGTTSEENGAFELNVSKDKNLIFSAIGFETKKISISNTENILLNPTSYQLEEVVVQKRKGKEQIEIGNYKKKSINMYYGAGVQPTIIAKFIEPTDNIKKHPFIEKITFLTDSNVKNAKIKIRFFDIAHDGSPGSDYSQDIIIVTVKEGKHNNHLNLKDKNIFIPKRGLFIAFEWMIIEENKYTYEYTIDEDNKHRIGDLPDLKKKVYKDGLRYEPIIGTVPADSSTSWQYSSGKWFPRSMHKKTNHLEIDKFDNKYGELAVKLTLTN